MSFCPALAAACCTPTALSAITNDLGSGRLEDPPSSAGRAWWHACVPHAHMCPGLCRHYEQCQALHTAPHTLAACAECVWGGCVPCRRRSARSCHARQWVGRPHAQSPHWLLGSALDDKLLEMEMHVHCLLCLRVDAPASEDESEGCKESESTADGTAQVGCQPESASEITSGEHADQQRGVGWHFARCWLAWVGDSVSKLAAGLYFLPAIRGPHCHRIAHTFSIESAWWPAAPIERLAVLIANFRSPLCPVGGASNTF